MPKTTSPGRVSQLRLRMPVDSGWEISYAGVYATQYARSR